MQSTATSTATSEPRAARVSSDGIGDDSIEVVCPSGLSGRMRGLIGRDYRNFNKQMAKTGEGMSRILNACWVSTQDPGIYKLNAGGNIDWADALVGDRLYALIAIRRAMFPDEAYAFDATCRERNCRERIAWEVKLEGLPIKPLPAESVELLRSGKNEFSVEMAGTTVWFSILTGRDQVAHHKLIQKAFRDASKDDRPSDIVMALAARIRRVDALGDDVDYLDKVEWLEAMSSSEHRKLIRRFESVDGGVETKIEIECQASDCGALQEIDLPFDGSFLFPK